MLFVFQDISDLFGADLPVEGGWGGEFAWRCGQLLQTRKAGHWVVLDEVGETVIVIVQQFFKSLTKCTLFCLGETIFLSRVVIQA